MVANLHEGPAVLDIAGGTGDLALAFAKKVGSSGQVVHTDINEAMLRTGRDRLLDAGVVLPTTGVRRRAAAIFPTISIWSAWPSACAT
jgi:demethylmenaquinone methyltransferase/2-methoxy-6-polyprenyl-1,4-benzoquinol methylase